MSDPTLRLTFQAMQIRIADYLGMADRSGSALAVPTDAKDLELVKRLVNDGYRRFITEDEKWNFLNVPLSVRFYGSIDFTLTSRTATTLVVGSTVGTYADDFFNGYEMTATDEDTGDTFVYTVVDFTAATGTFQIASTSANLEAGDTIKLAGPNNVAGEAWRYYLPDDFYGIWKQQLVFGETGPRVRITEVTEAELREMRAGARTTGTSLVVAFRPINTTEASTARRWEAMFWPEPSSTDTVTGVYKRFPALLSANGDASVAGFQHDDTVMQAAYAAAEFLRHDSIGIHEQMYQAKLDKSKRLDARSFPRQNRPYGDRSDPMGSYVRPSSDYRPDTYNGAEV